MDNIYHPVLSNNSIFKVHKSNVESFLYAILAALYSHKIDRRSFHNSSSYEKYKRTLNLKNILFPITLKEIPYFLKNNPHLNISIRLFDSIKISQNDMKIYSGKIIGSGKKIINILFHKTYKNKKSQYHFFWIKNINNIKNTTKQSYVCTICYDRFSYMKGLNKHLLICNCRTEEKYPAPNTFLFYDDKRAAKFASPITVIGFADFECKLENVVQPNNMGRQTFLENKSITIKKEMHSIISFSLLFVDSLGRLIFEKNYCGDNAGDHFFKTLDEIEENLLLTICKNKAPLDIKTLTPEEMNRFNSATKCEICHIEFDQTNRLKRKNLDHDHYTNKFRYASCTLCNLLNRSQNHTPIYFHNFCSYDSKLLLNIINKQTKVRLPPKFLLSNLQKLRYLTYNSYKFKDSIEHLPSSLSKMVTELNNPSQNHKFPIFSQSKIIRSFLGKIEPKTEFEQKIKLLTGGKGIYPYTLCNDAHIMKKLKKFPKINMFFNDLSNTPCTLKDYNFAKNVYNTFNCKNLYEYTILYNHCDTLLLAEIMLVYRKIIQDNFKIDCNHFLGIPALAFNLMLKISKVKIELLSNPKINLFFRNAIKGGMSFISKRYAKSDYYDSNIENYKKRVNHIRYIDANNLYGSQMLFDLPIGGYMFRNKKFVEKVEKNLKQMKISKYKNKGMFLEVNLIYPDELHAKHRDFPLAPERYNVMYNELSPLNKFLYEKMKSSVGNHNFSEQKLIPTFHERNNYILHIKCLIFYLNKGLILKRIHRIVTFNQSPFLKEYILTLTKLRSNYAKKNLTFFVNIFKFLANSTYGKFAQTPLNYTFAELCLNKSNFKKCINSERFLRATVISKNVAIVEYKPTEILFDSPFSIAATILDLSKLHVYKYYYDILIPTFQPDKIQLLLTDTDSIIFEVTCENFFEKYKKLPLFDFSNFKRDNLLFSDKNRKALLYFKDENPTDFIQEFVGLRSKLYAIKTVNNKNELKCKGYNRNFRDSILSFKSYKICHKSLNSYRCPLLSIRGFDHQLYTIFQNKVVLNNFDSKVYLCNCNIHTYPYGSNELKSICTLCQN